MPSGRAFRRGAVGDFQNGDRQGRITGWQCQHHGAEAAARRMQVRGVAAGGRRRIRKRRIAGIRAAGLVVQIKGLGQAREKDYPSQQYGEEAAHRRTLAAAWSNGQLDVPLVLVGLRKLRRNSHCVPIVSTTRAG